VFSTVNPDGTKNTAVGETMDAAWATELVRKALGRADIPVEIDNVQHRVAPDGDLADQGETFTQAYGLGPDSAVLVRPDAVVAWRASADVGDPRSAVEEALRRLLFRQP
jgi:putative polyketide hydroxylase